MKIFSRQSFGPKCLAKNSGQNSGKTFGPYVLTREDLLLKILPVVYDMLPFCHAIAETTVSIVNEAVKE